jgi:hypothetical protein
MPRQHRQTKRYGQRREPCHGDYRTLRELRAILLNPSIPQDGQQDQRRGDYNLDKIAGGEADWIIRRQSSR